MGTLQVQVQDEMLARIETLAQNQECGADQIVTEALGKHLQWHETQMQLWNKTQVAISEADRGDVDSAEDVFAWLDTWGQPLENAG